MLKLLTISNLAVISHLQLEFESGFNVLSGETGAGKSIILAALRLLLGERASQDILRTGETRAFVEGVFDTTGNSPLLEILSEGGIELEEDELIIKREIIASSRGKVFINNQSATVNLLRQIQPHLIDVHGQGDQQSLIQTQVQTAMLDAYARSEELLGAVREAYLKVNGKLQDLRELKASEADRLQRLDLLDFQIAEIERVNPRAEEDVELEQERRILANAEKLVSSCSEISGMLYDADDAAVARIALAERRLGDLASLDPVFAPQLEALSNARYLLEDAIAVIRDYGDSVTFSEARLQVVEERLVALERLRRKYGKTLAEIEELASQLAADREALVGAEFREQQLNQEVRQAAREYLASASKLTAARLKAARDLEKKLKKDLQEVALEKAEFSVRFNPLDEGAAQQLAAGAGLDGELSGLRFGRNGEEQAEFYFSANKGEEARPLASVASGGELSRLMLLLKSNIAPTPYPRTLVFDEIDTGIGGRVADAVGLRLRKLAKGNQVLCVTHQAQIARYADAHLLVAKAEQGKRTVTTVTSLDRAARVAEIARMLSGGTVTELTLKHADEFLSGTLSAAEGGA